MPGTLFVVATPIGNLEDLTFRALRVLREADLIAAEDTRRTAKLLAHYEIRRPMVSFREHNEARETPRILSLLQSGQRVALVSDAGTPGIADPGARLIRSAHERGLTVTPIPGPSAVTAALSASGFPADQFVFRGFPPASGQARADWLQSVKSDPGTVVFFEAPHRIRKTLKEISSVIRPIVVARELSKVHEFLGYWPIDASPEALPELGEYVIVLGPTPHAKGRSIDTANIVAVFGALTEYAGISRGEAAQLTAKAMDLREREVLKAVKEHRISVKRQNIAQP
jgi:16S rRNA (cytidine1402-2'-O)-methyltransferase